VSRAMGASRHRVSIHQAAAIWTLVFLIGLTGGELLRQKALDAPTLAAARGPAEPTAATPAPAANAAAPTATSTATTTTSPPQTTTTVHCDPSACLDYPPKHELRTEDGKGHGHGARDTERGHGRDGGSGPG
jgi:Tfp pilus assembly protein FimV